MVTKNQISKLQNEFSKNLYCLLPNLLSSDLQKYLKILSKFTILNNSDIEDNPVINKFGKNPISYYSSPMGDSLLELLTPLYSLISNKNLIPTYSYFRKYFKDNNLEMHTDRPSCQYSITLHLDNSNNNTWGLYLDNKKSDNVALLTPNIGDLVFYKGEDVIHGRDYLKDEWSNHIFLHWVDKDDPNYKEYWYDSREKLGPPR